MNIATILAALALAAIGATVYFLDSIGLGIALIVCAAVVSQMATLPNIGWRYARRKQGEGQHPAPLDAVAGGDLLESAVAEIEEGRVDTRSFLKNLKAALHPPDGAASSHGNKDQTSARPEPFANDATHHKE
ncbi:hypothetical protein [Ottowia sp.]|uniref:hypothetical protein n=1 Tax=Ottowia sp. TaxID=1898956 RepID=UPI0025FCF49C|nr:hypothetical protein [Ottowia sp.]MBK6747418.1 hypothetical protein [Ottowia sp.]